MIDYFALGLTHALLAIALLRLVRDDAIDPAPEPSRRAKRNRQKVQEAEQNSQASEPQ